MPTPKKPKPLEKPTDSKPAPALLVVLSALAPLKPENQYRVLRAAAAYFGVVVRR